MKKAFVNTLLALARADENIWLVTGDIGFGVLTPFWEQFSWRFVNAGIAEQAMMGMAAGLALEGKTVFVYSIANFPSLRCLEQIRNDCACHNANVKIVSVGAGFAYGAMGNSHHGTEDAAVLRVIPGVTVVTPCDPLEAAAATHAIAQIPGTCYLRLGRGGEPALHQNPLEMEIGKALRLFDGQRAAIFTAGAIAAEAVEARVLLAEKGFAPAVYSLPFLKPMDTALLRQAAREYELLVTVEEHTVMGGLGSAVAETLAELDGRARLLRIGLQDALCPVVGTQQYLRERHGLCAQQIAERIWEELKEQ